MITYILISGIFITFIGMCHNYYQIDRISSSRTTTCKRNYKLVFLLVMIALCLGICLLASIHYLFIGLSYDEHNHYENQVSVLAGIFSLLVTFLVGWQIYSTITAKDELNKALDNIRVIETRLQQEVDNLKQAQQQLDKKTEETKQEVADTKTKVSNCEMIQTSQSNLIESLYFYEEAKCMEQMKEDGFIVYANYIEALSSYINSCPEKGKEFWSFYLRSMHNHICNSEFDEYAIGVLVSEVMKNYFDKKYESIKNKLLEVSTIKGELFELLEESRNKRLRLKDDPRFQSQCDK